MSRNWKFLFITLVLLLLISLGTNLLFIKKNNDVLEFVTLQYVNFIDIAELSVEKSLENENDLAEMEFYYAMTSVKVAMVLGDVLGVHKEKYYTNSNVEIYVDVASEMSIFLDYAQKNGMKREEIEKVHKIFEIYAEHIDTETVKSPEGFTELHREIQNKIPD